MQTQGQNASSLWGGSSNLNGLDSNWGGLGNQNSTGANFGLGLGTTNSLSSNSGHNMQSGASSSFGDSNALLGNSSRMNFGAPGTLAPGHSAMKTVSGGNMQGSLSASGAQTNGPQSNQSGLSGASSQLAGLPASSQGNSAFGGGMGFQKAPIGSGSGPGLAPGATGSNAQNTDNLSASGWGMPSSTNNSALTGTSSWLGNPSGGADWDQQSTNMSQSQQQIQSSNPQFRTANPGQPPATDNQRPSSWAQAAGKGLNLHSNNPAAGAAGNVKSPAEIQREAEIRKAIESHDGWGKKPIRQDTEWSIEASPKVQSKFSTQSVVPEQPQQQKATNNMWNNNNGTAIWEANKDGAPWNNNAVTRPVPGQTPANWAGGPPQNMPNAAGNQWGGGPAGQNQMSDKTIGSWGTTPDGGQPSGNNWGSSTEVGSWGGNNPSQNSTASGGISTWGEDGGGSGWGDATSRPVGGSNGTAYWGDPAGGPGNQQQQQWGNQPTAIGQRKPPETKPTGWGEVAGPPDSKVDDGTSLWASNNQPPPNSSNWGDSNQQWAIGKPRPNPQQNPAAFGGVDDLHWNTPQEDIWSEESMKGWDDADMGTWSDSTLENNSTWNSATGFNKNLRKNSLTKGPPGAIKLPGATPGGHPQMRSRLLQQLMDLGFKKEDAQGALINNNMNIQNALSDLYSRQGAGRKDGTMDMFQVDGNKPRIPGLQDDDISDTPTDSNSFVPNLNMQNTPYNNAQSQLPNQFPFNKSSLSQPSRNNPNTSINSMLQNKIIHKMHNQQPPPPTPSSMNSINQSQGPLGGRVQLAGNSQQQMAQQQILQQLQMAVQAGLISPALLNQQLPPGVLVMLQQLLQLQQVLQQLITAQQNLSQNKAGGMNPLVQRQQQENQARISAIRQQILSLQKKIAQAQKMILNNPDKPQTENSTDQSDSLVKLSPDFNKLSVSTSQPTSRLNKWKLPSDQESPDDQHSDPGTSETPTTSSEDSLNKAVGSKPIQQSQSTPNLRQNYNELGLNNLGGDSTWSVTPTSSSASLNWPSTSTPSSTASQGDSNSASSENKESQQATSTTGATSSSDSVPAMSAIPEFVPGKPWLGLTKNPEDDPHITPGSLQRALSVNMVKDDYLTSLSKSSPTSDTSTWPNSKPLSAASNLANKPWSPGSDMSVGTSLSSDVWGMSRGGMSRPPPGLPQGNQRGAGSTGWTAVGRQHSWAGLPTRSDLSIGSVNVSTSLVLKNLTPQIDGSVLRTLCMQHGPLQCFFVNSAQGQALVKYSSKDEAMKAQNSLNNCPLGNTTIMAEFVSDNDAMRFVEQQNAISAPSQWPPSSAPVGGNRQSAFGLPSQRSDDIGNWNTSSMGSGSSMWGSDSGMKGGDSAGAGNLWTMDDPHSVLGNIYG